MRNGANKRFARGLRTEMTDAERHLWRHLRRRQLADCRFRRQHPMGSYIADFACIAKRLIVELDGAQHNDSSDADRDAWFQRNGYRVLRFWNNDVLMRTGELAAILPALEGTRPHPSLPPHAGEGVRT